MKITALYASLIVLFFTTISCDEKLYSIAQNKDVIVNEAYTQTEVPGQEKSKPTDYLKLKLDVREDLNFKANSIFYKGKQHAVSYNPRMIKINLAEGTLSKVDTKLQNNQALLSYTISGVEGQLMINNIESKEDLYLP